MEDFLTVKEAAEKLQLIEATVRGYIRNGTLKATKLSGAYFITKEDLDAFLKKRGAK